MKTFGENLKQLMKEKRLSVRELADAVGVSSKTVQEWIGSGVRTPRNLDAIRKLAGVLNCSVHFLLYGEDDPTNQLGSLLDKTEVHTGLYEITIKKVKEKNNL